MNYRHQLFIALALYGANLQAVNMHHGILVPLLPAAIAHHYTQYQTPSIKTELLAVGLYALRTLQGGLAMHDCGMDDGYSVGTAGYDALQVCRHSYRAWQCSAGEQSEPMVDEQTDRDTLTKLAHLRAICLPLLEVATGCSVGKRAGTPWGVVAQGARTLVRIIDELTDPMQPQKITYALYAALTATVGKLAVDLHKALEVKLPQPLQVPDPHNPPHVQEPDVTRLSEPEQVLWWRNHLTSVQEQQKKLDAVVNNTAFKALIGQVVHGSHRALGQYNLVQQLFQDIDVRVRNGMELPEITKDILDDEGRRKGAAQAINDFTKALQRKQEELQENRERISKELRFLEQRLKNKPVFDYLAQCDAFLKALEAVQDNNGRLNANQLTGLWPAKIDLIVSNDVTTLYVGAMKARIQRCLEDQGNGFMAKTTFGGPDDEQPEEKKARIESIVDMVNERLTRPLGLAEFDEGTLE